MTKTSDHNTNIKAMPPGVLEHKISEQSYELKISCQRNRTVFNIKNNLPEE